MSQGQLTVSASRVVLPEPLNHFGMAACGQLAELGQPTDGFEERWAWPVPFESRFGEWAGVLHPLVRLLILWLKLAVLI